MTKKPKKDKALSPSGSLTLPQVVDHMPIHLKHSVTQDLVDNLNNIAADPEVADAIRDNFISYTKVLQQGKFKTEDYLNAVKFVSYKLMGYTNFDSYCKAFPTRHAGLVARGATRQEISSYVSMYSKGKLVNLIMENALVPTWVLNQDIFQKAINVQAELMLEARSEMVRMSAANSLLTHLAKPKEAGPLVNLDMRETAGVNELRKMLSELAQKQIDSIQSGSTTTKEIAAQVLVEKDYDDGD